MSTARTGRVRATPRAPTQLVTRELALVEQRLADLIHSQEPRLSDISNYLIASGGKRVRPAVTILVFRACGGDEDSSAIVDVAAALELIHSATLLHDDIIDGGVIRRGQDSALRKYGVAETLVTGDFLFSRAFQLCARFDERLINWAAEACISLTEGEIMQGRFRRNPAVAFSDYMEIVTRKTASLFQQGARTAAHLARASDAVVESMATCGLHVGLTFQMVDDLLDITGAESQLGKSIGIDLRDGNPSLPVVLALDRDPEVRRMFQQAQLSEAEIGTLLARLRRSPVVREGQALAARHAERAGEALRVVPDSAYRRGLLLLIDQLVQRAA